MDAYFWAKALHLVSVVSWFAGLFYIGRLFIYHAEALQKGEPERGLLATQFAVMERRLWRAIMAPAAIATLLTGTWLLYLSEAWRLPWFHLKAVLLVILYGYHDACNRMRLKLDRGQARPVRFYRFWNEAATVLLFMIVFTAVFKRVGGAGYGLVAVAVLTLIGMSVFLMIRRSRRRSGQ
jgi:putative membrane protein